MQPTHINSESRSGTAALTSMRGTEKTTGGIGADLEARDQDGESPMDVAPSARVKVLLRKLSDERDAAENDSDNDGSSYFTLPTCQLNLHVYSRTHHVLEMIL